MHSLQVEINHLFLQKSSLRVKLAGAMKGWLYSYSSTLVTFLKTDMGNVNVYILLYLFLQLIVL